jgi:hypothetical protein
MGTPCLLTPAELPTKSFDRSKLAKKQGDKRHDLQVGNEFFPGKL